jgi:hypothetical protein
VVALVVLIALATVLLRDRSGHERARATSAAASGPPSVLTPEFHGLALAAHARDVVVGAGIRSRGPVDVVVIPSDGRDVQPARVHVQLGGRSLSGGAVTSCGFRCLRFPLHALRGTQSTLSVTVSRKGKPDVRVSLPLPARMPPAAARVFRTARTRMLRLRSFTMDETLGAGLSRPVLSKWWFRAPDRMRYSVAGGGRAVVIGTTRWDYFDRRWQRSSSSRLNLPSFPWQNARNARLVGRAVVDGIPTRIVSVMSPGAEFPTWFRLYVMPDDHVARMQMLTTAHFMTDAYRGFNAVAAIRPPK